jgi:transcription antitermination factor NusG
LNSIAPLKKDATMPDRTPDHRTPDDITPDDITPEWFALWTRARAEARVEARLLEREIEGFGALTRVERRWADRTRMIRVPLFPGYVFARLPRTELIRALEIMGVAGVVRIGGQPAAIPDHEIHAVVQLIHGLEATGAQPEVADPFEPGTPIVVVSGPFEGLSGVITEGGGPNVAHVVVRIPAIQQAKRIRLPRTAVAEVRSGHPIHP